MKLASYMSTRPGVQGVFNRLIRWRLDGLYSHTELVFEPGDGVDRLMPDGTCQPGPDEALWCVSSVAAERMPPWSRRRAGRLGGVRFKRIRLEPARWDVIDYPAGPMRAAILACEVEGELYDWQLISAYIAWLIPHKADRWSCSEIAAWLGGIDDSWRFDPCALRAAVMAMGGVHR
ncbi:MAG TPA: hypothetical protein VLK85_20065 [Ramlibacter sp.]|nr:hypothetical protein [Ramlibacter sp.]